MTIDYIWWKESTVYQIWPASYKDSNGDGFGDLQGIISTLDYLSQLGIDIIWLSPMYDSPQDDMGYDISDYQKIYIKYGNMNDMDQLIDEVHKRGMKLILDLVINHTSSEHQWFKESRSSIDNPKRNWYIWKPPRYDEDGTRLPPNNWGSYFSGSAWEYDEVTNEYYLRLFAKSQPDLNWENEETRQAIYNSALRFWLEKGVNGFRVDAAGMYSKDQKFLDAPIIFSDSEFQPCQKWHLDGPRIHEFHKEMFSQVTSKYDLMTVGEYGHGSKDNVLKYVSAKEKELNMVFLMDAIEVGFDPGDKFIFKYKGFDLKDFKKAIENQSNFFEGTDGWSTVFLENHDQPRSVSRFGNTTEYWSKSAKLLLLLQITLKGTLFIYQGQEIGMTNLPREWSIDEYSDIFTLNFYKQFKQKYEKNIDFKNKEKALMDIINLVARDNARSPVQWDSTANGGFSTGTPWTRINDNFKDINVAAQVNNTNSILCFWKESLKLRKEYKHLLVYGSFELLDVDNPKVFSYLKTSGNDNAYVVLNFSKDTLSFEKPVGNGFRLVLSNVEDITEDILSPYEGRLYISLRHNHIGKS